MIWDILFWLSLAWLAVVVIYKLIWPFLSGGGSKAADRNARSSLWWWITAGGAVIVVALSSWLKTNATDAIPDFSEDARTGVVAFAEAMDYYSQATYISKAEGPRSSDDWETVHALLEAALDLTEPIPDTILNQIHPELTQHVRTELIPGLHAGTYGLMLYIGSSPKDVILMTDSGTNLDADSLETGTELLNQWNLWYENNRLKIEPILTSVQ